MCVHRYQLRVCVEACKHRLLTIDNRSISWNTALAMLHLPPGLQEGDAFAALTEVSTGCSSTHGWPHEQPWQHNRLRLAVPAGTMLGWEVGQVAAVCLQVLLLTRYSAGCPCCLTVQACVCLLHCVSSCTAESTPACVGHVQKHG